MKTEAMIPRTSGTPLARTGKRLKPRRAKTGPRPSPPSLLHELQVRQIELELQNAKLQRALQESEQTQYELLAESRELHSQLKQLALQYLVVQEEERKKISRDLHDDITQLLAGISVQLDALEMASTVNPADLRQRVEKARQLVVESIGIVHDFAHKLRSSLLDDLGLVPALRSLVKELRSRHGLKIRLSACGGLENLDSTHRTVLYRVAQEALTNVLRHAQARQATVRIAKIAGAIRLEVRDNGKSIQVKSLLSAKPNAHLGLVGMRERVEMVGGLFSIESAPGKGTTVNAEIPVHCSQQGSVA